MGKDEISRKESHRMSVKTLAKGMFLNDLLHYRFQHSCLRVIRRYIKDACEMCIPVQRRNGKG